MLMRKKQTTVPLFHHLLPCGPQGTEWRSPRTGGEPQCQIRTSASAFDIVPNADSQENGHSEKAQVVNSNTKSFTWTIRPYVPPLS